MTLKVVKLDQTDLRDMAFQLRRMADDLENDPDMKEVCAILVVEHIPGKGPVIRGFGDIGDRTHTVGLLFQAAHAIALPPIGGETSRPAG